MANDLLQLGSTVTYGDEEWIIGAVAWLGERYYFLTRPGEVAMIPAATLTPKNEK